MTLAIGILTAPRPRPTLHACTASLVAAGFDPYTVFSDIWNRGNKFAYVTALRQLIDDYPNASHFMMVEDDVTFTADASLRILPHMPSTFSVLSLHAMAQVTHHLEQRCYPSLRDANGRLLPGVYSSTLGAKTWGSQCLVYPRHLAEHLCRRTEFHLDPAHGIDRAVFGALAAMDVTVNYLLPCVARHDNGINNSALKRIEWTGRQCEY